jgi:hypothetical protein
VATLANLVVLRYAESYNLMQGCRKKMAREYKHLKKHQFKPGVSGNPNGKPKGTPDRRNLWYASQVSPHKDALIEKALEKALKGDGRMLEFFLDRILPKRSKDDGINVGGLDGALGEQARKIVSLTGDGHLTPSEGNEFLQAIMSQGKIIESHEIVARIEELEKLKDEVK